LAIKHARRRSVLVVLPTTAVCFHANFADPNQTFHFIKNLIMTGGLLQIVANVLAPSGPITGSWLNSKKL